jgi:hypothetical protein
VPMLWFYIFFAIKSRYTKYCYVVFFWLIITLVLN